MISTTIWPVPMVLTTVKATLMVTVEPSGELLGAATTLLMLPRALSFTLQRRTSSQMKMGSGSTLRNLG